MSAKYTKISSLANSIKEDKQELKNLKNQKSIYKKEISILNKYIIQQREKYFSKVKDVTQDDIIKISTDINHKEQLLFTNKTNIKNSIRFR